MPVDTTPVRLIIDNGEEVPLPPEGGGGGGGGGGPGPGEGDFEGSAVYCSDDFLGLTLSKKLGMRWRSTPDGRWYEWTGQVWAERGEHTVLALSRVECRKVSRDVEAAKLARDVTSKGKVYAAAKLAAIDPRHVTAIETFDAEPWVLNTPDGIVDLRDGQIRRHDPGRLLTKMTRAGAAGEAPRFRAFLDEATQGDAALQSFLQRVAGYCLTGSIEEHAIFFLYDNGLGGTGKGTFVNTLTELLADYAAVAPMDMFTIATGERHPAELALLHNVRLVTAQETEEGRRWDEAKLKAITGGDPITARYMRGNFFTFRPTFKLVMSGNHRPRMRSADRAMRRRFHMIPFLHRPERIDKDLSAKLRAEQAGILRWAVAGVLDWRRVGLAPPYSVVEATDEYFESENAVGRWMGERCVRGPNEKALTRDLYRDFKSWAAASGEFCPSERNFSIKLQQQPGLERWRDGLTRANGYRGLAPLVAVGDLFESRQSTTVARGEGGLRTAKEPGAEPPDWEPNP